MKLFIHIPKTGGMTIRHGLKDRIVVAERRNLPADYATDVKATMDAHGEHHGFEHARWRDVRKDIREKHPAFAIVRNPWDRVLSRYTFAKIANDKSGQKTFRKFLDERHEYGGKPYFWHRAIRGWYPQRDYVVDLDGAIRCDILRFGTDDIERYFGLEKPLRIRNVSNTQGLDYREFYSAKERRIVEDWYAEDIEFFGFTFDGGATKWTLT